MRKETVARNEGKSRSKGRKGEGKERGGRIKMGSDDERNCKNE